MDFLPTHWYTEEENAASPSGEKISGDEVTLFREAMQGVRPLAKTNKVVLTRATNMHVNRVKHPSSVQSDLSIQPSFQDHFPEDQPIILEGEKWSFVRPGLQRNILRRLRRGYWPIQDEVDLHGLNRNEAYQMLVAFLDNVLRRGYRCVRVIHGRGLSSKDRKPILKKQVGKWLLQINEVLAFCQAQSSQGGSGATLVLLRNSAK